MTASALDWLVFMATTSPVLPQANVQPLWLGLSWAAVLASLCFLATRHLPLAGRVACTLAVAVGVASAWRFSPAFWLGLAFQTPSLSAMALSIGAILVGCLRKLEAGGEATNPLLPSRLLTCWAIAGVVLGWLLMLDTLAMLPVSLYAWGFSVAALGGVLLVLGVPVVCVEGAGSRTVAESAAMVAAAMVLVVFVLWRLPTGNLWDALLDPLLWLWLNAWLMRRVWRRFRAWRVPAAIHA